MEVNYWVLYSPILPSVRTADPASAGIDRFAGLEHLGPENLRRNLKCKP